jgi:hypothetical protein
MAAIQFNSAASRLSCATTPLYQRRRASHAIYRSDYMVTDFLEFYEYFVQKKAAAIRKFTTPIPIRRWSDLIRIARCAPR